MAVYRVALAESKPSLSRIKNVSEAIFVIYFEYKMRKRIL